MWLLDTNVVSESVQNRPNKAVLDWIGQRPPIQIAISIVTLAELRMGVQSTRDAKRRLALARWMDQEIERTFADRTLPVTIGILIEWLELGRRNATAGNTRAPPDLLI